MLDATLDPGMERVTEIAFYWLDHRAASVHSETARGFTLSLEKGDEFRRDEKGGYVLNFAARPAVGRASAVPAKMVYVPAGFIWMEQATYERRVKIVTPTGVVES